MLSLMGTFQIMLFNFLLLTSADRACDHIRDDFQRGTVSPLILNFFRSDQGVLESCLKQFSKIRNYFVRDNHGPCLSAAVYSLANVFSTEINSTMVTNVCAERLDFKNELFPSIYPVVNALEGAQFALHDLWKQGLNRGGQVIILQQPQLDLNFAYCDTPKIKLERPWNFSTLTSPFQTNLWGLLILTFLLVSLVLIKFDNDTSSSDNKSRNKYRLTDTALLAFTALLSTPFVRKGKRVIILVLWMYSCQIIAFYYTGSITSRVIAPARESTLSSISDLAKNDYRLVFDFSNSKDFVNSTALGFLREDDGDMDEGDREIREDMHALNYLLSRQIKVTNNPIECITELISLKKLATVQSWPFVISKISHANDMLQNEGKLDNVHCYLGQRLVPSPELYYGIFLPLTYSSANLFLASNLPQWIYETGIYHYWMSEHMQIQYSKRVQDRVKFISPTKIRYNFEDNDMATPIELSGRISSVFFMWFVGIFGSMVALLLEILFLFWKMNKTAN